MHHMLSNKVICFLNLFSLLVSIPIIGAGLWMTKNSTTCQSFLQKPLLIVGLIVLIISLAGFIGSYYQVAWALKVYLVVMLLLIVTLLIITIFGSVVTSQGGGIGVPGRLYREFQFKEYSPWLRDRLKDPLYWNQIRGCIFGSKTCNNLLAWTPFDYLKNDLTPVQVFFPLFCFIYYFIYIAFISLLFLNLTLFIITLLKCTYFVLLISLFFF